MTAREAKAIAYGIVCSSGRLEADSGDMIDHNYGDDADKVRTAVEQVCNALARRAAALGVK